LGEVLDPIADKGLVLSAIITLSLSRWEYEMPDWFPLLVISRDLALVIGFAILRSRFGPFKVKPTWEGKVATLFQMTGISLVLLQWNPFTHVLNVGAWKIRFDFLDIPIFFAGLFTLISGLQYLCRGIRISKEAGKNGGRERSG
jgi:phosphatidylglycerophosphate synthase